jgi:hypothetical protein
LKGGFVIKLKCLVIIATFLFCGSLSAGENGAIIQGKLAWEDGSPLRDGTVQVLDALNQKIQYETTSESTGEFTVVNVKPGSYFINMNLFNRLLFMDHPISISIKDNQTVNIGNQRLKLIPFTDTIGVPKNKLPNPPNLPLTAMEILDPYRQADGTPVMTVCEYMKIRSTEALYWHSTIFIVGILEQTTQGMWLKQTCNNNLRSGDFTWPNAIALQKSDNTMAIDNFIKGLRLVNRDYNDIIKMPNYNAMDPKDRNGNWVAVCGSKLITRDGLVAAPCGNNNTCGFGYGLISAPAQLSYEDIHYFKGSENK